MRSPFTHKKRVSFLIILILSAMAPINSLMAEGPHEIDIGKLSTELQSVNKSLQAPCPTCETDSSPARNSGLCKDLHRFTCAPGEYNDGTGTASTSGATENKLIQVRQQAKDYFTKQFEAALKKTESDDFQKMALSAFGLTYSPACEDEKRSSPECNALLIQGLNDLAMKRIFPALALGQGFGMGLAEMGAVVDTSLREIDLLIQNPAYQEIEKDLASYARSKFQDKKATERIQNKVFPEVQKLLTKVIGNSVSNPKIKQSLITKMNAVRFEGTDCSLGQTNTPSISSLLVPNAFYDSEKKAFHYCNGLLLSNQSEFQIAFVIAHELGHSVDPCDISNGPNNSSFKYSTPKDAAKSETEFPFSGLISCLRSDKSVAAKRIEMPQMPGAPMMPGMEPTSSTLESPFCMGDQIGEGFCDWLAAEVLPEYIANQHSTLSPSQMRIGYSNVFRGNCNNADPARTIEFLGDPHPSIESRVNRIFLVQPKIRQQMGCPVQPEPDSTYCSVKEKGAQ